MAHEPAPHTSPDRPYAEVIGDPIVQSKSPLIHRFWLEAADIDADYRATRVVTADVAGYLTERRDDPLWRGCNVTMPLKQAVLDHVDDPGDVRNGIGAANTVFRADAGGWTATNTDAAGFMAPLGGVTLQGEAVTVIGTGGAARAILWALARVGAGAVTVLARSPLKGAALLSRFGLKGQALPLPAAAPPARLTVNASPLGMAGQPPLTMDLAALPEDAWVYDIVYSPLETELLRAADARGLETVDGLEMLVAQAALAFELFFGVEPPRDDDDALRAALMEA